MPGPPGNSSPHALSAKLHLFLEALIPPPGRMLAAISGGSDSTALLHALANLPNLSSQLVAVHVNHRLRDVASDRDEDWVRAFCARLGVALIVRDGALDADDVRHRGVEAAARSVRYRIFEDERVRLSADCVATAHTRSDQAETVLLRLITGRGTWRLSGILPVSKDHIVRPLLRVSRDEVREYLREHRIEPCHDESNDDHRFLRNRIRNELLPMLASWNPRIEELLADTASFELDRAQAFAELLAPVRQTRVREQTASASIQLNADFSPHVMRMLLFEQIRRLDPATREVDAATLTALAESRPGSSRTLSPILRATRENDFIHLHTLEPEVTSRPYAYSIAPGNTISVPEAGYSVSLLELASCERLASSDRLRQVIQMEHDSPAVFEIRSRRPGDRFRPLGMTQDKNLADFLIDRRIPVEERDSLPLLVCNGSIAWVAGVEVGDGFKVSSTSGRRFEVVARRIGGAHERDHGRL